MTPLAEPLVGLAGIDWSPASGDFGLVLTISGPQGLYLRQEVGPGETAQFSIFDEAGALRPAGSYVYELRPVPQVDPATRAELAAARERGEEVGSVLKGANIPATEVQHGAFAIRDGEILMGGETEPGVPDRPAHDGPILSPKDIVHADDVIINGGSAGLCVGFDCVNGESFGFDTIRVKENNTRIQFDDTSTGSFPTNNWQIRANSNASGGQSFLAFVDQGSTGTSETGTVTFQVTAGAPANSLVVDSTGRVGLRTSTPVLDLHISTSNTPAMRLEQTSAGGFTAQTWDIAGNEANFFVRDVTGGSRLPFRIRPGAPTSSIDISASGNVGVGTAAPSEALHVSGSDGDTELLVEETNGTAATRTMLRLLNNGGTRLQFDNTSGDDWTFTAAANFNIDFSGSASLDAQFQSDGDLLILGSLLAQNGASTFPDFVFADDYPLMPLDELAEFVAREKHLPKIPSAGEVAAEGSINMTELQLSLLEKVEELTLYTLAQERVIQELGERLEILEGPTEEPVQQ